MAGTAEELDVTDIEQNPDLFPLDVRAELGVPKPLGMQEAGVDPAANNHVTLDSAQGQTVINADTVTLVLPDNAEVNPIFSLKIING